MAKKRKAKKTKVKRKRKVEPPTYYVQHTSKAKRPTQLVFRAKKKTQVAAAEKKNHHPYVGQALP